VKPNDLPVPPTPYADAVDCTLTVNGHACAVQARPGERLIDLLRGPLGLTGTKEACGRGECGACTVLLDGRPVLACLVLAAGCEGQEIATIEGLAESQADLRAAFADHGAFQCGFCTPGQVVRGAALLAQTWPVEPRAQECFVRHEISGNLCRCTGYTGIVDALVATYRARKGSAAHG
jgi:aerobic-type carbon monoxide dehydrogenase small subunit (CoxS/CutS family)